MIDWVHEACKSWGRCTRWILADTNEDYPSSDTIERARQGMLSMGGGTFAQRFREVRVGDALAVMVAISTEPVMPLTLTAHVWTQYVVTGTARHKLPGLSRYLGVVISVAEYWRNLDRAHHFLAARIPNRPEKC